MQEEERVVALGREGYPKPLGFIPDPPPHIHVRGRRDLEQLALSGVAVAIVGARDASPYGLATARDLARSLSERGITVVSGLARGIDGAAHRGAIEGGGATVAVVGSGTDVIYPWAHRELRGAVLRHGLVVGEWPAGTPALPHHFPSRNRLISGLCLGVVVVEATIKSGSLHTARHALDQGREVFAVPGPIGSPRSEGPHALLKAGAKLVETVEDVLAELPAVYMEKPPPDEGDAEPRGLELLREIAGGAATVDAMGARLGRKIEEIWMDLVELEVRGLVRRGPGGHYRATLDHPPARTPPPRGRG
jgi:DNA processing protein